ncbi:MAG TPA: FAD-dependent oxidoreductase, partial [Thermoanaerobaculia bacterium]|nr:FAD-dependent oxidoreductase [Thermoanaerobaculia bacterium]
MRDVIVIGGGAAGLAATRDLAAAGRDVLLLEARNRLGGRVHTLHEANVAMPIELGPEFVHGEVEEIFRLARGTSVLIDRLPDLHHWSERGKLRERDDFWQRLERILVRAAKTPRDVALAEFLKRSRITASDRKLVARFVEGYHA